MPIFTIIVAIRARQGAAGPVPGHEFLLVQNRRRGGTWELPGGRGEPGEDSLACAQREFLEETGRRMVDEALVQERRSAIGHGFVYACQCTEPKRPPVEAEITDSAFFARLPPRNELSFPDDPYEEMFAAVARHAAAPTPRGRGPAGP